MLHDNGEQRVGATTEASEVGDDPAMSLRAAELVEQPRSEGVALTGEGGLLTGLVLQAWLEIKMIDHLGPQTAISTVAGLRRQASRSQS